MECVVRLQVGEVNDATRGGSAGMVIIVSVGIGPFAEYGMVSL